MALSPRAIRVFAAVEVLRDNQADIRHALAALFEPDLAKFNDQVFDPEKLADEINSQYHLGITTDVVEGFSPIFEEKKWIKKVVDSNNVAYVVTCQPYSDVPKELIKFRDQVAELAQRFRQFILDISPLNQIAKSDSELIDDLVEWLLALDRANEDGLKTASTAYKAASYKVGKKIVLDLPDKAEGGAHSESDFLSARFVDQLFKEKSPFIPLLIELAEVGLVTEVVRDFQRPTSPVRKSDLVVYLDAPLALDYLGLSGTAPQASIDLVLNGVRKLGGSVRVFRESVEEMQANLHAMLNRPVPERTGPTADALRRREVLEAFVRQVAAKPDGRLEDKGVAVLDQNLEMYPNEHRFFPKGAYGELYSQIAWVREDAAKHHDAAIATIAMRKRAGTRSSDVFNVKHVVLTRNPQFSSLSRRIARENNFIGTTHVGPVIHQRQLATAVWLRIGTGRDAEVPRSYVLAACRRVLTLRKNIVDKVHQFKSSLSEPQAEQLEILLAEGRSAQILMDKTLGSANVINSSNIELLLEEMKRAQIADYSAKMDKEIEEVNRKSSAEIKRLVQNLADVEVSKGEALGEIRKVSSQLDRVLDRLVIKVNKGISQRRLCWAIGLMIGYTLVTTGGFYLTGVKGIIGVIVYIILLIGGGVVQFSGWISKYILKDAFQRADFALFCKLAHDHGFNSDEALLRVRYERGRFVIAEAD